jgi:hypothetical protein
MASDPDGSIEAVFIRFDDTQEGGIADGTTSWSYTYDTTSLDNGVHAIYAISYDGEDSSNIYSVNITIKNIIDTDNKIPTINIIFPKNNEIISNQITVKGTSSDIDGIIQKVEIKINTESWNIVTGTTNWSYNWNTTTIKDGKHTISARSYDGEKYSNIFSINIIIDNIIDDKNQIPIIKFTHPLTGDNVSGIKNIYGSSIDSDGIIQYVQIKIDTGPWKNVNGTNLWSYIWDTTNETNGKHTIYARSYDGQDYSTLTSINLIVNNKSTPGFELVFLIIMVIIFLIIINSYKKNNL